MATQASKVQTIYQDVLANYLISMARTVENSVESALDALLRPNMEAAGGTFEQSVSGGTARQRNGNPDRRPCGSHAANRPAR